MSDSDDDGGRPFSRRRRRNDDDAMLGIFADSDSDGEKKRDNDVNKRQRPLGQVMFESAGSYVPGSSDRRGLGAGTDDSDSTDSRDSEREPMNLLGHAFNNNSIQFKNNNNKDSSSDESDAKNPPANLFPTSFQSSRHRRPDASRGASTRMSSLSTAPDPVFVPPDADFAKFEQHTKGFGLKALKLMGFKGRLGKDETGVARPITTKLRPKGAGLGMIDERTSQQKEDFPTNADGAALQKGDKEAPMESEQVRRHKQQQRDMRHNWKKKKDINESKDVDSKKAPTVYMTVEDVLKEARGEGAEGSAAPPPSLIVDMRGPTMQRVSIASAVSSDPSLWSTPLPVLSRHLFTVTDQAEGTLRVSVRHLAQLTASLDSLCDERRRKEHEVQVATELVDGLTDVLTIMRRIATIVTTHATYTPADALNAVTLLALTPPFCYCLGKAGVQGEMIVFDLVFPLIEKEMVQLLKTEEALAGAVPGMVVSLLTWRQVLAAALQCRHPSDGFTDEHSRAAVIDHPLYLTLLVTVVVPPLQSFILPLSHTSQSMHLCVRLLLAVAPANVVIALLQQLVLPRVSATIESWRAASSPSLTTIVGPWLSLTHSPIPVHLIPVLPSPAPTFPFRTVAATVENEVMLTLRRSLLPLLRIRISTLVSNRISEGRGRGDIAATDAALLGLVQQGEGVLPIGDVKDIVKKRVIPYLIQGVRSMRVTPPTPDAQPLLRLQGWVPLVGVDRVLEVIGNEVFPRLYCELWTWLSMVGRGGEGKALIVAVHEGMMWYQWWRQYLERFTLGDTLLLHHPMIIDCCRHVMTILRAFVEEALGNATAASILASIMAQGRGDQVNAASHHSQNASIDSSDPSPPIFGHSHDMDSASSSQLSIRDALSHLSMKHNLTFLALNRRHDGWEVFRLGAVTIAIGDGAVKVRGADGVWSVSSISNLVRKALDPNASK